MGGRPRVEHKVIAGVEHKQCFRCKNWFPLDLFCNQQKAWDGLRYNCKKCDSIKGKGYYEKNKEEKNRKAKIYRSENKEKLRAAGTTRYRKKHGPLVEKRILHKVIDEIECKKCSKCKDWLPIKAFCIKKREWDKLNSSCRDCEAKAALVYYANNKEAIYQRGKAYKKAHPERVQESAKKAMAKILATEKGRLRYKISNSIGSALKGNKNGRHWEDLVPYTLDQLIKRLKKTLPKGYTWQDYLDGLLHIDHIVPVSVFNFEKPEDEDFQRCFALKNLQLLPALENIIKSNKLDKHFQPSLKF